MDVNGDLNGIRDSSIEILDSIYGMKSSPDELASREIVELISVMTGREGREISVYINRRGKVIDVSVGDLSTVSVPEFDFRRGGRRLSGVRCVHTHPNGDGELSDADVSALINLRLDLIAAVGVKDGKSANVYVGYIKPEDGSIADSYTVTGPMSLESALSIDAAEKYKLIEGDIDMLSTQSTGNEKRERVLLVALSLPGEHQPSNDLLDELAELASAAGGEVVGRILQKKGKIDNAYYIGSGKAKELAMLRQVYGIDTIIFDDELSGAQVRNLEEVTGAKVIDRTVLIMDIFASRAMTSEGKLQVELAQLKYSLPRLVGLGATLSRPGGGIGTRGPGEKKLEIDRRRVRERIDEIDESLREVIKNRSIQREKREKSLLPMVSLIGYTNSGKSTLRNTLVRLYEPDAAKPKQDVLEADMLFATLDPTTRLIRTAEGRSILVSDTVGFIRKLPHDLVDAFKATLEEVVYADLLVHVVDCSAANAEEQIDAVNKVISELGVDDKPIIVALNKADKVTGSDSLAPLRQVACDYVEISALYGRNIDALVRMMEKKLYGKMRVVTFRIPYDRMSVKAELYDTCSILSEAYDESGAVLKAEVDDAAYRKWGAYIQRE